MERERIIDVFGGKVRTQSGVSSLMGNFIPQIGDYVYVDSGYVFGHQNVFAKSPIVIAPKVQSVVEEYGFWLCMAEVNFVKGEYTYIETISNCRDVFLSIQNNKFVKTQDILNYEQKTFEGLGMSSSVNSRFFDGSNKKYQVNYIISKGIPIAYDIYYPTGLKINGDGLDFSLNENKFYQFLTSECIDNKIYVLLYEYPVHVSDDSYFIKVLFAENESRILQRINRKEVSIKVQPEGEEAYYVSPSPTEWFYNVEYSHYPDVWRGYINNKKYSTDEFGNLGIRFTTDNDEMFFDIIKLFTTTEAKLLIGTTITKNNNQSALSLMAERFHSFKIYEIEEKKIFVIFNSSNPNIFLIEAVNNTDFKVLDVYFEKQNVIPYLTGGTAIIKK